MIRKYTLLLLVIILFILDGNFSSIAKAQEPNGSDLKLLASDAEEIVLELTVTGFQIETLEHNGQTYQRLLIPDMVQTDQPGDPQVPTRGTFVGLPTSADVSVQVLEADYKVIGPYQLYPAPGLKILGESLLEEGVQEIFTLNQERYTTNSFYPDTVVEIGHTGHLRDQALAQVQFYPIRYNPVSKEIRFYHRIRARITWETPSVQEQAKVRGVSPVYEPLLRRTLLNYADLARPPIDKTKPTPGVIKPDIGATSVTPALKIGVTTDGLYELVPNDLSGAGFDLNGVDLNTIKLKNKGIEIPIYIHDDNNNNIFDGNDYILFYGTALTTIYTTKNIYWLEAGGGNGQRMNSKTGTPAGAPVPDHFPVTLHAEQDSAYWITMPNGQGQDHWFWGEKFNAPESRNFELTIANQSTTASTATVRVGLQGVTVPNHDTKIHLNGQEIDDQTWFGQIKFEHEITTVPHALLISGTNVISVEANTSFVSQFYVNWIEIDYWDRYVAENNELLFGAPSAGTFQFEVTNFSSNDIQVFDVTDPANVAIITNAATVVDGSNFKVQFEDAAQATSRYLALTSTQRKSPATIELDQASAWKSPSNGADYIIITHPDFYASALKLANHRSATGLRVATVKVDDIYDEFNAGIFDPQAIQDFLAYTYQNWTAPAPIYVVLLGGASYDYRDLLNLNRDNYVPTQIIETDNLGQTPSDNWFVLVSGADILPDMFVGRLTAQSVSQAEDMVDKIINYEQNPPSDAWNKKTLFVADDDEFSFEFISEEMVGSLPFYYTASKVYVDDYPPGNPTADIIELINSGQLLVNYTGHGNVDTWGVWDEGRIFRRSDMSALSNTGTLPVITVANCLNGFFTGKNISMAEDFMRLKNKGAVAVWAATSLDYPSGHRLLLGEFYQAIFQQDQYALGEATTTAKLNTYAQSSFWGELVETFVLFGDPAMQLGLPTNYPYLKSTTPADGAADIASDQQLEFIFNKPVITTSVTLSGPGTIGQVFTPTWNIDHTRLTYNHTGFGDGQNLIFTIDGQDKLGNSLGQGLVPATWSFTISSTMVEEETFHVYLPLLIKDNQ